MIGQVDQCPPPLWFPCFTLPWAMNRRQHTPHRVSGAPGHDGGARRDGTGRSGPVPRELRPRSRRRVDTRTYLKITIRGHGSSKHDGNPLIFMTSKFCLVAQMQWNPILRQVHLLVLHTAPQPFHEHVVHPSPLAVPGVAPFSWTPDHCAEEVSGWQKDMRRTRRSTVARWWSGCGPVARLVPLHSGFDRLDLAGQRKTGSVSGATSTSRLRARPAARRRSPRRSRPSTIW